ncbi:MAG: acyl--CoA ligase [Alphaproteobacteria bacterium]|nr:acyl--CoA ligase [Alphaproteobacteria bacterium]
MHYAQLAQARDELTGPGGAFEITTITVNGHPVRAYATALPDVRALWQSTAQFADRPYLVYGDERLSYAQAHARVDAIAAWLAAQGVQPGDRVAIAMRNYPEWLLIYWACVATGITVVGMNAWWTPQEMAYALGDAAPRALFLDAERLERFRAIAPPPAGITLIGVRLDGPEPGVTPFASVIAHPGPMPAVAIDPDADACIFYTSGTTGFPKGAQLTHRGCITNLFNMLYAGASTALAVQRATGTAPPAAPAVPVVLLTTPLFHVTANNCGAYAATAAGGTIVLMYRWDAGEALRIIARERVTSVGGVPVMARELINHPDFASTDLSSLTAMSGGGAQVPPDLVHKIEDKVAGARPGTGYGMTETCGIITSNSGDFFVDKPDSAGPAMPAYETKCVDDAGNSVPQGDIGELWVRGAAVIKGYINRPEATAASITDGWLHTGDIARIDEHGFIFIVDRKKDMVLRGGENVYCAEVEAAIYRHPAVAECCVFGVPDQRLGEDVGVAVVIKPDEALDAETLRQHCASLIASYKLPRHIWFQAEPLPRNASGKFLRRALREQLAGDLPAG